MTPTLASIIWCLGIVAWCVIRYPYQRRARKFKVSAHKRSLEERLLLSGATVGLVIVPAVWLLTGFPSTFDTTFHPWLATLGAACMLAFLWLFHAVHRQLGTQLVDHSGDSRRPRIGDIEDCSSTFAIRCTARFGCGPSPNRYCCRIGSLAWRVWSQSLRSTLGV